MVNVGKYTSPMDPMGDTYFRCFELGGSLETFHFDTGPEGGLDRSNTYPITVNTRKTTRRGSIVSKYWLRFQAAFREGEASNAKKIFHGIVNTIHSIEFRISVLIFS